MRYPLCKYPLSKSPGSHLDIDARAMSQVTRAYLREQHAIDEAQGGQPEDTPAAEEKRVDLMVRHPSMRVPSFPDDVGAGRRRNLNSDTGDRGPGEIAGKHPNVTGPSRRGSTWSSVNGSARSPASVESGGASSSGTHGRSHSSALDSPARHEDGGLVLNLSKEHDTSNADDTSNGAAGSTTPPADGNETWDDFRPHILHDPHDPVPIAIVNRRPTGSKSSLPWSSIQRELIAFGLQCPDITASANSPKTSPG